MLSLKDEFTKHAPLPVAHDNARRSDTQSDAEGMDVLTFEYEDNPFTSFMKKLETLMETDPQEALRLIRLAIADEVFERKSQLKKLSETLDEALDLSLQERERDDVLSRFQPEQGRPQKDFFKAAYHMPAAAEEPSAKSRPSFSPAPPACRPFAA